ncbi:Atrophin-1 multi-domain protein [Oxalobacteraceae bacterium OTU3CAMAD1]|nr:Atrophin-1 multi-domain protein [Oxalobacteraceae bacterium OTU3CAMAD1]
MRFSPTRLRALLASTCIIGAAMSSFPFTAQAQNTYDSPTGWGNYNRMFSVDSPWNTRPLKPKLGTFELRKPVFNPGWIPAVGGGDYSLTVFKATANDKPVTVHNVPDPDSAKTRNIVLPHWPAGVTAASGSDGHADIVDTQTGIVHSFFQLKYVGGKWTATMYSWSRLDGRGWGDAVHWSQGARASGVPASGGLIRKHEIDDGAELYRHVLAMALPSQSLANGIGQPTYVYPATTADTTAYSNTGAIPLGTRIMLPAWFDHTTITNPALRKIANTLKIYGAFVVDRTYDTAYSIYVENGAKFTLMPNGWDTRVVADLERMRSALRPVVWSETWVNGAGKPLANVEKPGVLSMRGDWQVQGGGVGPGSFDTWQQALTFPYTEKKLSQINYSTGASHVSWAKLKTGEMMRFTSVASGGATIRLQVRVGNALYFDSSYLGDGSSATFAWPNSSLGKISVVLLADSGVYTASKVRGVLTNN